MDQHKSKLWEFVVAWANEGTNSTEMIYELLNCLCSVCFHANLSHKSLRILCNEAIDNYKKQLEEKAKNGND